MSASHRPASHASRQAGAARTSDASPVTHRVTVRIDPAAAARWRRSVRAPAACARRAAQAALAAGRAPRLAELTVYLTSDGVVRRLNSNFRGKDKPTNVLSFPASGGPAPLGAPILLGDVVIAYQTVVREAAAQGKSAADHVVHLVVHGVLHLLGYDHERVAQARVMESFERRILARLGVADPYAPARQRA